MSDQKVTSITVDVMKTLRPEINAALKELGEKFGLNFSAGNCTGRNDGSMATFKLEMTIAGGKTKADVRDERASQALALYQKMSFPDLRLDFNYKIGKQVFEITGFNTRARTKPMEIRDIESGEQYKCSIDQLRKAKAVQKAA